MTLRCSCGNLWTVEPHDFSRKCPLCKRIGEETHYRKLREVKYDEQEHDAMPANFSGYGVVPMNADHSGGKVVVHRTRWT